MSRAEASLDLVTQTIEKVKKRYQSLPPVVRFTALASFARIMTEYLLQRNYLLERVRDEQAWENEGGR